MAINKFIYMAHIPTYIIFTAVVCLCNLYLYIDINVCIYIYCLFLQVRRFLTTLQQFASEINSDAAEKVRGLTLNLMVRTLASGA